MSKTTLVTVTYGNRWHLLKQVLKAAIDEGVDHAIVVNNGAKEDIAKFASPAFGDFVTTVTLEKNTGSAFGFKIGLEKALAEKSEFILLLDDDNLLLPGCLNVLKTEYINELSINEVTKNNLALLAYRPDHQADLALGVPIHKISPRLGSYFGFHILDIPFKIWRRTIWGKRQMTNSCLPKRVIMDTAPWGGLFFHSSLVKNVGLPNDNFILYGDDTEYSRRIYLFKGLVILYTEAEIRDIEQSWSIKKNFSNHFDALLKGDDDFRAYYGTRNQSYLQTYILPKNIYYPLNRIFFILILKIRSYQLKRKKRFKLLKNAIIDGEKGQLGINQDFQLFNEN